MDPHLLIEGAAAIVLVVVGGFFVTASWRVYARRPRAVAGPSALAGAPGHQLPLVGVPLVGLVVIIALIALASAGSPDGPRHEDGHDGHGSAHHGHSP